jgi:DNA-binding beta-propeller fold protein YncE
MKTILAAAVAAALAFSHAHAADAPAFDMSLQHLASIGTDASAGTTGAEIVAYDRKTRRAFAINSQDNDLAVIDLSDPAAPVLVDKVSLSAYGAGLNSVDTHEGLVAVAVEASPKTDPGRVVFLDARTLRVRGAVTVGSLPDMLVFDDAGQHLLVANEGEAESYVDGAVNPDGSVSIVDLQRGVARATVRTADFRAFTREALLAQGIRVFGPGATAAQDLEPEYITVQGRTAWVTLQEANAIAVIDVPGATVTDIVPLGLKDHALPGQGLDPSDRDGAIAIAPWPVFGLYQPDAVASFQVGQQRYLVTANEGDSRDFPGFNEEVRVGSSSYRLDATAFPNAAQLKATAALGRLTVTSASGDTDADGDFDQIHVFGARSVSIWSPQGGLVWDSGDQLERFFADGANGYSAIFNSNHEELPPDNRSDNKGPEPEGVAVGRVGGRTFAFVSLERVGGVMAYDVTDPHAPAFAAYANTRGLAVQGGDLGAEGIEFVSEEDSPNGKPLVLVGNEVSRTVTVFQVNRSRR